MKWYRLTGDDGWVTMIHVEHGLVKEVQGGLWGKTLSELLVDKTIRDMEKLAHERGFVLEGCEGGKE